MSAVYNFSYSTTVLTNCQCPPQLCAGGLELGKIEGKIRYLEGSGVNFWLLFTWLLKVLSDIWFDLHFYFTKWPSEIAYLIIIAEEEESWHNVWVLSEFLLVILASFCSIFCATFYHSRVETWPNVFYLSWNSVWSLYFNYDLRKVNKRRRRGEDDGRKRTEVFIKTISSYWAHRGRVSLPSSLRSEEEEVVVVHIISE